MNDEVSTRLCFARFACTRSPAGTKQQERSQLPSSLHTYLPTSFFRAHPSSQYRATVQRAGCVAQPATPAPSQCNTPYELSAQ